MGAIVTKYEFENSDKDSIGRDISFIYVNDDYMYQCHLSYWINDSEDSEFYRLSMNDNVLKAYNSKWKFKSPNYIKRDMEAFINLIKDIDERFQIRIPVKM